MSWHNAVQFVQFLKTKAACYKLEMYQGLFEQNKHNTTPHQLLSWFHTVDIGDKANELKMSWESSDRNDDGHITLSEYLEQVGFLAVGCLHLTL